MRFILVLASVLTLAACAAPADNEPHPFDEYMDRSGGMDLPHKDNAPDCTSYGCAR
jgi:hypothetical protein